MPRPPVRFVLIAALCICAGCGKTESPARPEAPQSSAQPDVTSTATPDPQTGAQASTDQPAGVQPAGDTVLDGVILNTYDAGKTMIVLAPWSKERHTFDRQ